MNRMFVLSALASGAISLGCNGGGGSGGGMGIDGGGGASGTSATVSLVTGEKAWGVAVDGSDLFWTSNADPVSSIRKAGLDGAGETTLCTFAQYDSAEPLVVDATDVYALAGAGSANVYTVSRSAAVAGACTPLLDPTKYTFSVAWGIAQTTSRVYFALAPVADMQSTAFGFIDKASGQVTEITVVTARVQGGIAADDQYIYFSGGPLAQEKLQRLATTAGSTPTVVADGQYLDPVLDGTRLYGSSGFVDLTTGAAGTPETAFSPDLPFGSVLGDIAISGSELFELRGGAGTVGTVWSGPKAGGTFRKLGDAGTFPNRIAAGASAVFFTDTDDGAIRKTPR